MVVGGWERTSVVERVRSLEASSVFCRPRLRLAERAHARADRPSSDTTGRADRTPAARLPRPPVTVERLLLLCKKLIGRPFAVGVRYPISFRA